MAQTGNRMRLVPVVAQVKSSYSPEDPGGLSWPPARPGSSGGHGVQCLCACLAGVTSWRSASSCARWGMTVPEDLVREDSWLVRYGGTDALTLPGIEPAHHHPSPSRGAPALHLKSFTRSPWHQTATLETFWAEATVLA